MSLTELILSEATRLLTLREGGEPITLPAAQAVLRSLLVTAGKGNAHAQRTFLKLNLDAEAQKENARSETLTKAYRAKLELQDARDKWVEAGRDEMSMPVHPSDIEINASTGDVRCFISLTDEEQVLRAKLMQALEDGHVVLGRSAATIAEDGDDALLELGRELAIIKILFANELLPSRLRRAAPPALTVRAETAAIFLNGNWVGADDVRSALALKLNAGG